MFDQAQRSLWLEDQLWAKLRSVFPDLQRLPAEVLITVGYPSSGARGRSEKIRPAEINTQWTGNANERAFISIHPNYFDTPANAVKALLFQGLKHCNGNRWGAVRAGLTKNDDGSIDATPACQAKIDALLADIGEPPSGFGVPFPVRTVDRARLRKYIPQTAHCTKLDASGNQCIKHPIIRAASDELNATCSDCGCVYMKA